MVNRESINAKIRQSGELYASTIIDRITKVHPDLNPTFIDIIKDLSMFGYIDGATMILDALDRIKCKDEEV